LSTTLGTPPDDAVTTTAGITVTVDDRHFDAGCIEVADWSRCISADVGPTVWVTGLSWLGHICCRRATSAEMLPSACNDALTKDVSNNGGRDGPLLCRNR
jgi:hypothetical protein